MLRRGQEVDPAAVAVVVVLHLPPIDVHGRVGGERLPEVHAGLQGGREREDLERGSPLRNCLGGGVQTVLQIVLPAVHRPDSTRLVVEGNQSDPQVRGAVFGETFGGINGGLLQTVVDRGDDLVAARFDVFFFEASRIDEFVANASRQITLRTFERIFPARVLHVRKLLLIAFRLYVVPGGDHDVQCVVTAMILHLRDGMWFTCYSM